MTQQDDITQRLRDNADLDEAEHGNARVVQLEREAADEIERLRGELSKLRAPVADERAAFEYHARACELTRDDDEPDEYRNSHVQEYWNGWKARAALESAPVADAAPEYAYSDDGRTVTMTNAHRAPGRQASAPVADERPDEYEHFADWLKKEGPIEREVTKAEMARHGWMAGMRFADLYPLAIAPVAGEAHEPVAVVGADFALYWAGSGPIAPIVKRHGLKVGSRLYAAPQASAEPVQEVAGVTLDGCLETLFRVGEHLGINYAESRKQPGAPSGVYIKAIEDRISQASNAAREEAAKLMDQTSRSSGAELIRALKTQADKDGGQQRNWVSDWSAAIKSLPMGRSEAVVDKSPNLQGSSVDKSTELQGDNGTGQQRAGDAVRDALWTLTEHNALHFGEQHSTVIQGRAALSATQAGQGDAREA